MDKCRWACRNIHNSKTATVDDHCLTVCSQIDNKMPTSDKGLNSTAALHSNHNHQLRLYHQWTWPSPPLTNLFLPTQPANSIFRAQTKTANLHISRLLLPQALPSTSPTTVHSAPPARTASVPHATHRQVRNSHTTPSRTASSSPTARTHDVPSGIPPCHCAGTAQIARRRGASLRMSRRCAGSILA